MRDQAEAELQAVLGTSMSGLEDELGLEIEMAGDGEADGSGGGGSRIWPMPDGASDDWSSSGGGGNGGGGGGGGPVYKAFGSGSDGGGAGRRNWQPPDGASDDWSSSDSRRAAPRPRSVSAHAPRDRSRSRGRSRRSRSRSPRGSSHGLTSHSRSRSRGRGQRSHAQNCSDFSRGRGAQPSRGGGTEVKRERVTAEVAAARSPGCGGSGRSTAVKREGVMVKAAATAATAGGGEVTEKRQRGERRGRAINIAEVMARKITNGDMSITDTTRAICIARCAKLSSVFLESVQYISCEFIFM